MNLLIWAYQRPHDFHFEVVAELSIDNFAHIALPTDRIKHVYYIAFVYTHMCGKLNIYYNLEPAALNHPTIGCR